MTPNEKYQHLQIRLRALQKLAVAFSGGVDSTFLLAAAAQTLGPQNVLACIGISPSLPQSQLKQARRIAEQLQIRLLEILLTELNDPNYTANRQDRCFHCKSHQMLTIRRRAEQEGFSLLACGSNWDDQNDYRPGSRAVAALNILTPLMEAQLTKEDIRFLSRQMNLPTADLPASPCLASRIAYGIEITEEKLHQVEQAEDFLRSLGLSELRVRHHGILARIEVPSNQIQKLTEESCRNKIVETLKSLGFQYITLDLQGFRSGSLNEMLKPSERL
ncbi:MAG: ATP-dependent sacrificial sulfur transferase LarE [Anaerohalosphaeraceae bacterium]